MGLTLDDIRDAEAVLAPRLAETPLVACEPILLKAESLQPTGSFKVRGATYRIVRLQEHERTAGVVAYSTGNHAQAVAWAARHAGIAATVVMSPDAPAGKVEATRALGAEVAMADPGSDARRAFAEALAAERGAALVPPYDHLDVIAGQATIALEILRRCEPAAIYVPIGGGGLIAGIAAAVDLVRSPARVIGVEPELECDAWRSFHLGRLERLDRPGGSIAEAIALQSLGELTWPLIQRHVDDVVTVAEAGIARACRLAAEQAHLVLEPSGAVALAAALEHAGAGPVVAVASGGNVSLDRLVAL